MNRLLPLSVILISAPLILRAQSSSTLMGARSSGMGYTSSCLSDEWSVFNNVAGLAEVNQNTAAFSYDAQPSFKNFNKIAAVFSLPFKIGVGGLGVYRFGDNLYNEQILSGSFASKFGLASLGVSINYIQYNTEGFGRKDAMSISVGGIAQITPLLSVGAYITNINQPKLSSDDNERLPTLLTLGVSFKTTDKLNVATEIRKDLDYDATWKVGLEYKIHTKFFFRTGININPNTGFVGFGFKSKKFRLDYAYAHSLNIDGRHQATVGYQFKSK
ncbi:MAG: hypothetical protein ABI663_09970 [Chryseolinea sp.]